MIEFILWIFVILGVILAIVASQHTYDESPELTSSSEEKE